VAGKKLARSFPALTTLFWWLNWIQSIKLNLFSGEILGKLPSDDWMTTSREETKRLGI